MKKPGFLARLIEFAVPRLRDAPNRLVLTTCGLYDGGSFSFCRIGAGDIGFFYRQTIEFTNGTAHSMDTAEDIATQAYSAWELHEYSEAATLFLAAAELEERAASLRSKWAAPDSSFLHRTRAAFCQWENGDFAAATPTLIEATTFDWQSARLWGDRHDTEKAFAYLLLQLSAKNDISGFTKLWDEATVRGRELQYPFPTIVPLQKKLLVACINISFSKGCKQIIANVSSESLARDLELQMLHAQAQTV